MGPTYALLNEHNERGNVMAEESKPVTLHLMTQDDQPYGSQRRCCERCGVMIWSNPQPKYTEHYSTYANPPAGYVSCNMIPLP